MLIDYLPHFMQGYREIREILKSEDREITELQEKKEYLEGELFIESAEGYGISRMENILKITPSEAESLDYRKFRIRSKLLGVRDTLKESLDELIPNKGYRLSLDCDNLTLTLRLPVANSMYLNSVTEMLEKTVPLNILLSCTILYAFHGEIKKYTHKELSTYTHKEIKEDLYEQQS